MANPKTSANSAKAQAPATAPVIEQAPIPVLVAGHGATEDGDVYISFKNVVAKDSKFKAIGKGRASHNGSRFLAKGTTLDQAKEEFPLGLEMTDAFWGPERESKFGKVFWVLFEGEELEDAE